MNTNGIFEYKTPQTKHASLPPSRIFTQVMPSQLFWGNDVVLGGAKETGLARLAKVRQKPLQTMFMDYVEDKRWDPIPTIRQVQGKAFGLVLVQLLPPRVNSSDTSDLFEFQSCEERFH